MISSLTKNSPRFLAKFVARVKTKLKLVWDSGSERTKSREGEREEAVPDLPHNSLRRR